MSSFGQCIALTERDLPIYGAINSCAINSVTNRLYLFHSNGVVLPGTVMVIDCSTNTVIETITVGVYPIAIAVNPQTNKIYVVNGQSNSVSVIDGSTNSVIKTLAWDGDRTEFANVNQIGNKPEYVAVNPKTNRIYVVNNWYGTISVIDGSTDTVIDAICWGVGVNSGIYPWMMFIDSETNLGYVRWGIYERNFISIIDLDTNNEIGTIPGISGYLSINPTTNKLYLCNGGLYEINGATNSVENTIDAGGNVLAVTVNPVTNRLYVALVDSNGQKHLNTIDASTNQILDSIITGTYYFGTWGSEITVNPTTNKIYTVASNTEGQLLVFSDDQTPQLQIRAYSPVTIMIIDQNGRRTGYDSTTQSVINEIPDATYSGPNSEPQEINLVGSHQGTFTITLVGTGTGPFTLTATNLASDGSTLGTKSWTGTINPNEIWGTSFTIDQNGSIAGGNFFQVPEYIFGGLLALTACFAAFVTYKKRSSLPKLRNHN